MSINLKEILGFALFLLIVLFTLQYQYVKLAIIIILVGTSFRKIRLSSRVKKWVFIYIFMNLTGVFFAFLYSNPDPYSTIRVQCLWPVLYLNLIGIITFDYWKKLQSAFSYYLLALMLIGIIACVKFNLSGAFDDKFFNFESAIRPGFPIIAISGGGIPIFIFLYFYILSNYLLGMSSHKRIDAINVFLGIAFIFITSRRALYLDIILVSIIIWSFLQINKKELRVENKKFRKYIAVFLVLFFCMAIYVINYGMIDLIEFQDFFNAAFESDSDGARKNQVAALINGWLENPIFGNGFGVNAKGWVSNDDYPGAYEMTYHAMLFSTGLFGVMIFSILMITLYRWVLNLSVKHHFRREGFSLLIALSMILLSNVSNPYIQAFDFLWFLFIPLVLVNLYDYNKKVRLK